MKLLCLKIYLKSKFQTRVLKYLTRFEVLCPGFRFRAQVVSFVPRFEVSCHCSVMILRAGHEISNPRHKILNPDMKFQTWAQNFKPRREISNLGTKFQTRAWIFLPWRSLRETNLSSSDCPDKSSRARALGR
jgi:hypothetical protein